MLIQPQHRKTTTFPHHHDYQVTFPLPAMRIIPACYSKTLFISVRMHRRRSIPVDLLPPTSLSDC